MTEQSGRLTGRDAARRRWARENFIAHSGEKDEEKEAKIAGKNSTQMREEARLYVHLRYVCTNI